MNGLRVSDRLAPRVVDTALLQSLRSTFEPIASVECALLMGSHSRGIAHPKSNVDIQLVLNQLDTASTEEIRKRRSDLQDHLGCAVSINVHTVEETDPSLSRYDLFSHKNRADMFVLQAKHTAVLVSGSNLFAELADPPPGRMRREAIRTLSSFAYNLRKFIFDASFASHGAAEFVRTPLISLEYIAAFYGYVSLGYRDGLDFLNGEGLLHGSERTFLEECARRKATSDYAEVDSDFALQATQFLDAMHARIVEDYRRRGVSDVRWDGESCSPHWDIERPQAGAMCVMRNSDDKVLLLRRPPDDYLYPDAWTIPGGYVNRDESPSEAAAREVREETGAAVSMRELFGGRPMISPRLAAFAFDVPIQDLASPRLTEHTSHAMVALDDALAMDLTPEARLVLAEYAARRRTAAHRITTA